jgi:hypothetical protein
MPRRKSATVADVTETNATDETYEAGVDFDADSTEADIGEDEMVSGDQSDPFFATFKVAAKLVENATEAEAFHGSDNVIFHITRHKARSYTGRAYVGTGDDAKVYKGLDARNPSKAVRNVIDAFTGRKHKEYTFNAEDAEKEQAPISKDAGSNKPPVFIWQDTTSEEGQKLAALGQRMVEAEELYKVAGANERAGELAVGRIYNDARALYLSLGVNPTDKSDKSETAAKSNAEWGGFVKRYASHLPHVREVLADPGLRSRYGRYADAPAYVVEAMPTVNKATTFERKVNEAVSGSPKTEGFASDAIRTLFADKQTAAEEGTAPVATTRELWDAAIIQHDSNLDKVAQARTKWEADVKKATTEGNSTPAFGEQQADINNKIIGWLLGDDTKPTTEEGRVQRAEAFAGTKLHNGLLGAWEKMVKASQPKTAEEQEAANEATKTKTKEASEAQGKGIALMTVTEAAEVVANTIMAHSDPQEIANLLVEVISGRIEANAKAAAEKKEKANASDTAA